MQMTKNLKELCMKKYLFLQVLILIITSGLLFLVEIQYSNILSNIGLVLKTHSFILYILFIVLHVIGVIYIGYKIIEGFKETVKTLKDCKARRR